MCKVGFVILSHSNPGQLLRLVTRLELMFGSGSIVCHHDFERAPFNTGTFPSTVEFVIPPLRTFWGHISLIYAELSALRILYEKADPDWFYIVSGSDYPVMEASLIDRELQESPFDVYITFQPIRKARKPDTPRSSNREVKSWHDIARHRYFESMLAPDIVDAIESAPTVEHADQLLQEHRHTIVIPADRCIPSYLQCYAGDHWITGNRKIAEILLKEGPLQKELFAFFQHCRIADEAMYQTLLCNTSGVRLAPTNKRYSDWTKSDGHPKVLGLEDLPKVFASGAHFARKFGPTSSVLDVIDTAIDRGRSGSVPSIKGSSNLEVWMR